MWSTRGSIRSPPPIFFLSCLDLYGPALSTFINLESYFILRKYYTPQKKFCTTHSYFFVFKTSNTCEIWKNDLIKLKFSENVFCIHYCCFCKRPVVLRNETSFVQKPHFYPKMQITIIMCSDNVFTIIV